MSKDEAGAIRRIGLAQPGTGGVKSMAFSELVRIPGDRRREVITEPYILTVDGVEQLIVVPMGTYFAMRGPNPKPARKPELARINGKLFMEVL
jgi:hypothetical protein